MSRPMTAKQTLTELKKFKKYEGMTDYQIKKQIGGEKLALVAELQEALQKEQRKENKHPKKDISKKTSIKKDKKRTKNTSPSKKPSNKMDRGIKYEPLKYEERYLFSIKTQEDENNGYDPSTIFILHSRDQNYICDIFTRYMYEHRDEEILNNPIYKDDEEFNSQIETICRNLPIFGSSNFISIYSGDFQTAKMIIN